MKTPTVLITNDDGPPNDHDSPFIESFVQSLRERLRWTDIRVVIPASQKSWIGKAYMIRDTINVSEYRPGDGKGEPWKLLTGTPASCSNIAIHNLYPGEIDLVVSGPNYGRNTSSAFALSSGTVGAAMSASMSGIPAIALSYGIFQRPPPEGTVNKANKIACTVIGKLWTEVLSKAEKSADVYNINIPLTTEILKQSSEAPKVLWTSLGYNKYSRLFAPADDTGDTIEQTRARSAGPAAVKAESSATDKSSTKQTAQAATAFRFKPDISALVNPSEDSLVEGTDLHALHTGCVSVTPLLTTFAMGQNSSAIEVGDKGLWKL